MKFVSWNVNGLRACLKKGFEESVLGLDADFICLQETKMEQGQAHVDLPGYEEFWNSAEKKGYSGTAIFTRHKPLSVRYGMGLEPHDHEGRLITLEYPEFYLVNCYTPNAQQGLARMFPGRKGQEIRRALQHALQAFAAFGRAVGRRVREERRKGRAEGVGVFALIGAKGYLNKPLVRPYLFHRPAADQLRGLHCPAQRAGIYFVKPYPCQALLGFPCLTAARFVQGNIGTALQRRTLVPIRLAVPNKIQSCLCQKKALFP